MDWECASLRTTLRWSVTGCLNIIPLMGYFDHCRAHINNGAGSRHGTVHEPFGKKLLKQQQPQEQHSNERGGSPIVCACVSAFLLGSPIYLLFRSIFYCKLHYTYILPTYYFLYPLNKQIVGTRGSHSSSGTTTRQVGTSKRQKVD